MRIEFGPNHDFSEWEPEIARWLEEATGHDLKNCLISDESDIQDLIEMTNTGEWSWELMPNFKTGESEWEYLEVWDTDPKAYAHAREVLLRYGVDLDKEEDTRLISLAKKTIER